MRRVEQAICLWCKGPFNRTVGGPGRPRKYCTDACRLDRLKKEFKPAYRERERRKVISRYGSW